MTKFLFIMVDLELAMVTKLDFILKTPVSLKMLKERFYTRCCRQRRKSNGIGRRAAKERVLSVVHRSF